jgi:hypothetical protein
MKTNTFFGEDLPSIDILSASFGGKPSGILIQTGLCKVAKSRHHRSLDRDGSGLNNSRQPQEAVAAGSTMGQPQSKPCSELTAEPTGLKHHPALTKV